MALEDLIIYSRCSSLKSHTIECVSHIICITQFRILKEGWCIKSSSIIGHVWERWEMYTKFWLVNVKGKKSLARIRHRWKETVYRDPETGWEGADCIYLRKTAMLLNMKILFFRMWCHVGRQKFTEILEEHNWMPPSSGLRSKLNMLLSVCMTSQPRKQ
jgi:hypothetical protein